MRKLQWKSAYPVKFDLFVSSSCGFTELLVTIMSNKENEIPFPKVNLIGGNYSVTFPDSLTRPSSTRRTGAFKIPFISNLNEGIFPVYFPDSTISWQLDNVCYAFFVFS